MTIRLMYLTSYIHITEVRRESPASDVGHVTMTFKVWCSANHVVWSPLGSGGVITTTTHALVRFLACLTS